MIPGDEYVVLSLMLGSLSDESEGEVAISDAVAGIYDVLLEEEENT